MEAIKKKMASIKVDKDNALDRAELAENQLKDANLRAERADEDLESLVKKFQQIQQELIDSTEALERANEELELKEKNLSIVENERASLTKKVQQLDEDLEKSEEKTSAAIIKFEQISQAGDEAERLRKMFEHRCAVDEGRIRSLEAQLSEVRDAIDGSDKLIEETMRKIAASEDELMRSEDRSRFNANKVSELEEELLVVGSTVKSLEVSEEKSLIKQDEYELDIKDLQDRLEAAEARAESAEKTVQKLTREVDRLEDELSHEKERTKSLADEMDQTYAELTGY